MTDALYLGDPDEVARAVVGGSLTLSGDEGRHAVTSLAGNALTGEVLSVDAVPTPRWTWRVVQGLAKGDRGDLSVEILTEVGVHHLTAWQSQRSIVKWDAKAAKGLAKWQSTAREAATTPL